MYVLGSVIHYIRLTSLEPFRVIQQTTIHLSHDIPNPSNLKPIPTQTKTHPNRTQSTLLKLKMNTPAPSPTKIQSGTGSGKRVNDHQVRLGALDIKLRTGRKMHGTYQLGEGIETYEHFTPKEKRELEEQMRLRDEAVARAPRQQGKYKLPRADSSIESRMACLEVHLARFARHKARSMARIQKEIALMALKQRQFEQTMNEVADRMECLETKVDRMEVDKKWNGGL